MKKIASKKVVLVFVIAFMAALDFGAGFSGVRAEEEAGDVRKDINKVEDQLEKEQKELEQSQSTLNVTQSEINITAGLINKTKNEITRKETEIESLNRRIGLNKKILEEYVQEMFIISQSDQMIGLAISDSLMSEYWADFDQMISVKEKVLMILEEINQDKSDLGKAKEELAEKKEEHEDLLADKYVEKKEIVGEIVETQATIAQLQAKLSKLRSALSKFLGESYTMDDVIDAVKYADKKTGVRKEFLFAMLDKETDLGRFTGGCDYKKSKMGSNNEKIFKSVCDDLGYDYKKMKVSCALSYGIGGAMGVAQFMPSTWAGWSSKISAVTGNKPADPWNLTDGIIGMALKLKAAGAGNKSGEHYAAKVYYCGGPGSKYWKTHCEAYANTVVSWAKGYDDYF